MKLFVERERGAGIAVKDPVAVGVGRNRQAMASDELAEKQEVTLSVLLQPEDAAEDSARRVVEGGVEDEARPAVFEPGMVAAIHLDEEAGLRHAVPTAAMAGWPTGAGAANTCGPQQPLHGLAGNPEALTLPQQLGEVVIVDTRIGGARQSKDAGPDGVRETPRRGTAAVPMGQAREAPLAQASQEPTQVAKRETQEHDGFRGS